MTTQLRTDNRHSRHIEPPLVRGHRLHCPRCGGLLVHDHEDFDCVTCGYDFPRWGPLDQPWDAEPDARDAAFQAPTRWARALRARA
jgi:ribosomal protein S27AE